MALNRNSTKRKKGQVFTFHMPPYQSISLEYNFTGQFEARNEDLVRREWPHPITAVALPLPLHCNLTWTPQSVEGFEDQGKFEFKNTEFLYVNQTNFNPTWTKLAYSHKTTIFFFLDEFLGHFLWLLMILPSFLSPMYYLHSDTSNKYNIVII